MEALVPPKVILGQCKCCLKTTYLKNMWHPYEENGEFEVYGQMIVNCFAIDWSIVTVEGDNICQVCISKLRVATAFKNQVMRNHNDASEVLEAVSTIENITTEQNSETEAAVISLQNETNSSAVKDADSKKPLNKSKYITVPIRKVSTVKVVKTDNTSLLETGHVAPLKTDDDKGRVSMAQKIKASIDELDKCTEVKSRENSDDEQNYSDKFVIDADDVEFLEEDILEEHENDEDIEPETKKRKVARNLPVRNHRKMYKNYLEDDMNQAIEAVKSGTMTKREASRIFNVPRETIAIKINGDKYEGEHIDSETTQMPENDRRKDEITEIKEPYLQNDEKAERAETEVQKDPTSEIMEYDSQKDLDPVSELFQKEVTSDSIESSQQVITEILGPDIRHEETINLQEPNFDDNTKSNSPESRLNENISEILKFNLQENMILGLETHNTNNNITDTIQSDEKHNLLTEAHHETCVPEEQSDYQREVILNIPELNHQNNNTIDTHEVSQNYVLMEIEENITTQSPESNHSVENVLNMHKSNIHYIIVSSNATPIRGHWGAGYACYFCTKQFADPSALKQHTFGHQNPSIKVKSISDYAIKLDVTALQCNLCNNRINSLEDLMQHLKDVHYSVIYFDIPNHILPFSFDTDVLTCVKCFDQFQKFKDLSDHMSDVHYRNYVCARCDRGFVNVRSLKTHSIQHGITVYICSHCPAYFISKDDIIDHENNDHANETPRYAHKKEMSETKESEIEEDVIQEDNRNKFDNYMSTSKMARTDEGIFYDIFPTPAKVVKEWNIAMLETNAQFKCTGCPKIFKSEAALKFHTDLTHRRHKCDICSSAFDCKFDLQRHKRKVHSSHTYDCPKCPEQFTSQNARAEHIIKHKTKEFNCELCSSKFSDENKYMEHMKTDHGLE